MATPERHVERELEILSAIEEGTHLSQRELSRRLGVALGLTNLYLKRLAQKGYIKVARFPTKPAARKRLRYLLTPKGMVEKGRLAYEHMAYSLALYRRARQNLRVALGQLSEAGGGQRIALVGTGEAAELAYLTLKEIGVEPRAVFAAAPDARFLDFKVQPMDGLAADDFDAIIVATFDRPDQDVAALERRGIPRSKLVTLRAPAAAPTRLAARTIGAT